MRTKGYRKLLIGMFLLCTLTLAACGKEETPEPNYGYLPAFVSVPEKVTRNTLSYQYDVTKEGIYMVTSETGGNIRLYDPDREETQKLFSLPKNVTAQRLYVGRNVQELRFLCVAELYGTDADGNLNAQDIRYALQCYTEQGQLLWENILDGFSRDKPLNPFMIKLFMAEDGSTFMATSSDLYVFSVEGEQICKLDYPIENLETSVGTSVFASDETGTVYLAALSKPAVGVLDDLEQYKIYQWNETSRSLEEVDTVEGKMPLQTAEGDGLLFHDMITAYRYKGPSEEMETAFSLEENLIAYYQINKVLKEENGWKMLLRTDSGLQIASLTWGVRETESSLSIASANVTTSLKQRILLFNQRHPEYLLQVRAYGSEDVQDRLQQIQLSLSGKTPPDLVEAWDMQEYLNYARKGWLEDLSPYVEKSDDVSLEDFVPKLRESLTVNGGFYALPQEFHLITLAIPKSVAGDRSSWDIEEYLDFIEEYPDAYFVLSVNVQPDQSEKKRGILRIALRRGLAGFIDVEQGKVDLDNESFRNLMTRINNLQFDENAGSGQKDLERQISDGVILMPYVSLHNVNSLHQLENQYHQEMVLIGFPSAESGNGGGEITIDRPTGISSSSRNKEGAWCYLEESVTEETGTDYTSGFPARQKQLTEMLEEVCSKAENVDETDMWNRYTDMVIDAINTASLEDPAMNQLLVIISEEASYYFSGVKNLDAVIDAMESRAELYLNENK